VTTALKNVGINPVLPEGVRAPGDATQLIDRNGKALVSSIPNETVVATQPTSSQETSSSSLLASQPTTA
jgi:hypothetical protein